MESNYSFKSQIIIDNMENRIYVYKKKITADKKKIRGISTKIRRNKLCE